MRKKGTRNIVSGILLAKICGSSRPGPARRIEFDIRIEPRRYGGSNPRILSFFYTEQVPNPFFMRPVVFFFWRECLLESISIVYNSDRFM